jgi:putative peptidoglycan lipid II flippase
MFKNLLTVGGWTLLSRVLGLVRDLQLAALLGAGPVQDAYQVACRLPNMFRRLFGEGAFNAAFVPQFSAMLETEGEASSQRFAAETLGAMLLWLSLLCILGELFMPAVLWLVAPGFHDGNTDRYAIGLGLTRITLPYMVLICATALVSGVLNGMHRFSAAAAAYVAFNVIGIGATWIGAHFFHAPAEASAWGVTISGAVQLVLVLWATHRAGLTLLPRWPHLNTHARTLITRMVPGLIGSGVTQVNLLVDTMIASKLPTGAVSWLYFADRLNQLPLGVLGAAAGTTLLPVMTRLIASGDEAGARGSMNRSLDYTAMLTLPAAFGLMALAPGIIAALFGVGHFTTLDVVHSAAALRAYSLGLPAFVCIKVLTPGFYAHGDTSTPVRIGFLTIGLNLALNLLLYRPLVEVGPPLASTIAAFVNVGLLAAILYRRGHFQADTVQISRLTKMLAASVVMAAVVIGVQHMLAPDLIVWPKLLRFVTVVALIGCGGIVYLAMLAATGVASPRSVLRRFAR